VRKKKLTIHPIHPSTPPQKNKPLIHTGGAPAVGKTQLCMQLCMDVQIPPAFGGVGGQAVYIGAGGRGEKRREGRKDPSEEKERRPSSHIKTTLSQPTIPTKTDTEGSLVPERAADLAASLARHLARLAGRADAATPDGAAKVAAAARCTPEALLAGVTVLRARDVAEQVGAAAGLAALVESNPAVKLVVLDSVAFHVRAGVGGGGGGGDSGGSRGAAGRAAALAATAAALSTLARSRGIAVVLTNQVTTRLGGGGGGGGEGGGGGASGVTPPPSRLVPALGPAWAHVPSTRVLLHWGAGGRRLATLVKSPSLPGGCAEYEVTPDGVRGVSGGGGGKRARGE
jgi:RAD51-like protein 2